MTASAPSGAMKHTAKRPSDAKAQIIGQMPAEPVHSDIMSNSLGKTATRSKAGCMTCRIRRKKCDLQRANDSCQTCIRLRIGCLGWGAKRPEALRNPEVVKEIQRRIKVHLASNNMIKGSARSSAAATPAPQPSSTPSNDIPGGAAGGAGASYGGPSFLSFADLVGTNASSHYDVQTSASSRKGKGRQAKHAPVEASLEGDDLDGSGEEDPEIQGDPGSDEGASSFSRHPPGYPQPNYDPPQYRPRYPYEMGSPPQPAPYHNHPPHPYAQSDLRTRSHEYDSERDMRVDDSLRRAERDRETYRAQMPPGNLPRPAYDPNVGYPAFPGNHFVYGPGVGAASAGRALKGFAQYGHAGYRGPSPSNSLNSSFQSGPPPPKTDPFYSGPRLPMMDPRHAAALPDPPLSMSMSRSGGTSPTSDQYLQPMDHNANGNVYNEAGYRSPNPPLSRSPMGAGMTSGRDSISSAPVESAEGAADVDGVPLENPQLSAPPTHVNNHIQQATAYTPNPFIPHDSSFGPSYSFDKTFSETEADANTIGALVAAANNPAVNNNLPIQPDAFTSLMAILGVETLADANAAIEANANTTEPIQIAALQQLQVGIAPPPPIDSQQMYATTFGNPGIGHQYLQFTTRQMELLHLYKNDLCNLQYHIAHSTDSSIADELFDLAMHSEAALFGTLTLTSLYKIRLRGRPGAQSEEMTEVRGFRDRVSTALAQKKSMTSLDSGDAMAALHMVSAVLFDGGTSAEWDQFLDIAKAYVAQHPVVKMKSWTSSPVMDGAMSNGRGSGALTTTLDKKTQFIIKTVAWFDVIGSVTMRRKPYFLDTYRELFGRQGGAAMERIMGCNEKVLLAIAETAALAAWRREEEKKGTLNIMEMAQRAGKIEEILRFIGPQYNGSGFDELNGTTDAQMEQERQARTVRLVSNVFRATGMLYLHTVVSYCNPDVHDIKTAVQATVDAFKVLQASDFDRSLVFPITLAGCMTDNKDHRSYLEGRLLQLGFRGQAVGNSSSCLQLMQAVWKKRDLRLSGSRIVDWIDTMHELGWSLLLV